MMEKRELLLDLDRCVFGRLVDFDIKGAERGFCYPRFIPFDRLPFKVEKYSQAINRDNITPFNAPQMMVGVEPRVQVINEGLEGGVISVLTKKLNERINELEEENKRLRKEMTGHRIDKENAIEGVQKHAAKMHEMEKRGRGIDGERGDSDTLFGRDRGWRRGS